jgi:RNA polymerase sigma factor (sigma-70 family)
MGLDYGDLFTDLEIATAKQVVSQFLARNSWLKEQDFEDLLQECLIHWFPQRSKFQPGRGASVRTYMVKVLYNRLQEILREQLTDRRKVFNLAESLDQRRDAEETSHFEVKAENEDSIDINLRLEIEFVLRTLTPLQREICALLGQDYPVKQIAEILGRPRSTIRYEILRIRKVFSQRDLENH